MIKQRYPFLIFIIFWKIHCFSFETSVLYDAIEEQNPLKIIAFFDNVDSISFEESKELLLDIYHHFTDKFGIEVFDNQEYQNLLIKYTHLYHLFLESNELFYKNQSAHDTINFFSKIQLCKNIENELQRELPGSMILGGVEILSGALLWILPFPGAKQAAGLLLGDGIRRTFNGLEELDKQNSSR